MVLVESVYLQFSAIDAAVIFICYTCLNLIFCKDNANWLQCKTFSFVFMTFTYYMEVIAKIVPHLGLMSAFVLLACENDKEYMQTERLSFSSQYAAFYTMKYGILRCNTWLFVF